MWSFLTQNVVVNYNRQLYLHTFNVFLNKRSRLHDDFIVVENTSYDNYRLMAAPHNGPTRGQQPQT